MWRKPACVAQLTALRAEAHRAMAGNTPFDEPIELELLVRRAGVRDDAPLGLRRVGDLDALVAGVCDGLQAANPRAFEEADWDDLDPAIRPPEPIVYTDDSWICRVVAEVVPTENDIAYEVTVRRARRRP